MQAFLARFSHFFKKAPLLKEQLPCSDFFKEETRRKKAKYGKVGVIDQGGFFTMENCIFCKINNREIPSYKVYEDEQVYAFLDISQVTPGHTLVIPRKEVDYIFDMEDDDLAEFEVFAKKVAKAIKAAFPCKKVAQVVLGLEVPHAHIHLIPMNSEADVNFRKEHLKLSEEEFKEIADKIYTEFQKL